jgi:hypothetical protein
MLSCPGTSPYVVIRRLCLIPDEHHPVFNANKLIYQVRKNSNALDYQIPALLLLPRSEGLHCTPYGCTLLQLAFDKLDRIPSQDFYSVCFSHLVEAADSEQTRIVLGIHDRFQNRPQGVSRNGTDTVPPGNLGGYDRLAYPWGPTNEVDHFIYPKSSTASR